MKKIVLASLAGAVLFIIVGASASWLVFNYMQTHKPAVESPVEKKAKENKKQHEDDTFVSLKESVITLSDAAGEDHYMLLALTMVAESEEASKKILADEPLYQNIILTTLADIKYEQVRALKISEIKSLLVTALNRELKKRATPGRYTDILISKLVFQ